MAVTILPLCLLASGCIGGNRTESGSSARTSRASAGTGATSGSGGGSGCSNNKRSGISMKADGGVQAIGAGGGVQCVATSQAGAVGFANDGGLSDFARIRVEADEDLFVSEMDKNGDYYALKLDVKKAVFSLYSGVDLDNPIAWGALEISGQDVALEVKESKDEGLIAGGKLVADVDKDDSLTISGIKFSYLAKDEK
ncbi:MAG: hypothetical protein AB7P04_05835 [Bacteriovoracia bacterium]